MQTLLMLMLADLTVELPAAVRQQRLVDLLRVHFHCASVALLKLEAENTHLRPVAAAGLAHDVLGRHFKVQDQPRFIAILQRQGLTHFPYDSVLPDPYDGLISDGANDHSHVHDCMGISLTREGRQWGLLTLDALTVGVFDSKATQTLMQLLPLIEAVIRVSELEADLRAAKQNAPFNRQDNHSAGEEWEIIGQSPVLLRLLQELDVVADSELPVLLMGETGVGKELFAHRLHRLSRRAAKPMVHVNCAALPESLAESELFGHVKGAFSGANSDRAGRFEAADGGTLFLDEVGELPLLLQAKLLRALQNGEIQRLGEDTPRRVDVRVIAATNRNLREHVSEGSFRADLYHRLSVYPIPIPPLRERGNDVLLLSGRFLEQNRARLGLRSIRLSAEAEEKLLHYAWPGNVRELKHLVSRAALKAVGRGADKRDIVTLSADLFDIEDATEALPVIVEEEKPQPRNGVLPLRNSVEACQRQAIRDALAMHHDNWAAAARWLDIDASNLHKLARRLGIKE